MWMDDGKKTKKWLVLNARKKKKKKKIMADRPNDAIYVSASPKQAQKND